MWELDYKESWALKNWCFSTVVLEKTLESPLDCKELLQSISSSVIPFSSCPQSFPASGSFQMSQLFASGGQSIGVSASTSVLPVNTQDRSPLGWTGWMTSPTRWTWFGWTLGVGDRQGGLACCGSWGRKESDTTEQLNWTELNWYAVKASYFKCDS